MKCKFRGCDKDALLNNNENYSFCNEHSCKICSVCKEDMDFIICLKKAHIAKKVDDKRYTPCRYRVKIENIDADGYYNKMEIVCKYSGCEHLMVEDTICCSRHSGYSCVVCKNRIITDVKYGRCCVCESRKYYRCVSCLNSYKNTYMNLTEHYCFRCCYNEEDEEPVHVPVVGQCIRNIFDYTNVLTYPIKLHKRFGRPAKDHFLQSLINLPFDIILIILTYCSLQPSYITVARLVELSKITEVTILFFIFYFLF